MVLIRSITKKQQNKKKLQRKYTNGQEGYENTLNTTNH
jgi:hypothetical protein